MRRIFKLCDGRRSCCTWSQPSFSQTSKEPSTINTPVTSRISSRQSPALRHHADRRKNEPLDLDPSWLDFGAYPGSFFFRRDSPIVPHRGRRVSRTTIKELVSRTSGTFDPSQLEPMQPEFSSQSQPPQQQGVPSAPQSQQPQSFGAPGANTGALTTFPGSFPPQAGMQSASAAAPANQQQTPVTQALPMASGPPYALAASLPNQQLMPATQPGAAFPMAPGPPNPMYPSPQAFPWMFPQQAGMQHASAASLPNQQQTPVAQTAALPMASSPAQTMYAGFPSQPTWGTPGFPPQLQQPSTSSQPPAVGQAATLQQPPWAMPGMSPWAMMPGMSPWGMGAQPPMPMSPQMPGPSSTDLSQVQAQQQAMMYQQYMQAMAPWQFAPGGPPGWPPMSAWPPPPWMQSMHPNPGFAAMPLVPPTTAPPTTGQSTKSYIDGMSKDPVSSTAPPPYNQPKSGDASSSQITSTRTSMNASDTVNAAMSSMSIAGHQTQRGSDASPRLLPLKKGKITVIIVGETGVGKTAFMNLLANVCRGRTVDQFRLEHNSRNESNLCKNQSQTNAAMMYTIERADGVQIRILDTPGLCDTRGLDQDKEHKRSIAETIRDHVQTLDAVIIMANGTVERVGPGVEYALHTLASMFPRSISDNIGFMFTNVPDALSFNFQPDTLPKEIRHAAVWTIQNPVAQHSKYEEAKKHSHSPATLEKMEKLLQSSYITTVETLNEFFTWLDKRKSQPTNAIVDLYDMTTNIEAAITNVLAQIDQRERQRMDLKRLQNDLARNKQVMDINRQYQSIMQRDTHVQRDTKHHNTLCAAPQCFSNCHLECQLEFLMDASEIHRRCAAFSDGSGRLDNCNECNHSWRDHHHFHVEWAVEQQSETVVDDEAKARFNSAQSQADAIEAQKEIIERTIQKFEEELRAHEKHLGELCMEFQGLALAGSFSGHIASAIRMLEVRLATMKSSGSDRDSIDRMEERIESLRKQYNVVEKARSATTSSFRIGHAVLGEKAPGETSRPQRGGGHSTTQSRNPWGRLFNIGGA